MGKIRNIWRSPNKVTANTRTILELDFELSQVIKINKDANNLLLLYFLLFCISMHVYGLSGFQAPNGFMKLGWRSQIKRQILTQFWTFFRVFEFDLRACNDILTSVDILFEWSAISMRASECENEIILGLTLIAWIIKHAFIYINNNLLSLGKIG